MSAARSWMTCTPYVFRRGGRREMKKKNERYFQGRVWVDEKKRPANREEFTAKAVSGHYEKRITKTSFPHFETYRENITGPYWFPTYTHADDTLRFSTGGVHIRMTVKYANYKRFGSTHKIGTPVENQAVSNGGGVNGGIVKTHARTASAILPA